MYSQRIIVALALLVTSSPTIRATWTSVSALCNSKHKMAEGLLLCRRVSYTCTPGLIHHQRYEGNFRVYILPSTFVVVFPSAFWRDRDSFGGKIFWCCTKFLQPCPPPPPLKNTCLFYVVFFFVFPWESRVPRCRFCGLRTQGYCPDGTACRLKHELPARKRTREDSTGGDQGVSSPTNLFSPIRRFAKMCIECTVSIILVQFFFPSIIALLIVKYENISVSRVCVPAVFFVDVGSEALLTMISFFL